MEVITDAGVTSFAVFVALWALRLVDTLLAKKNGNSTPPPQNPLHSIYKSELERERFNTLSQTLLSGFDKLSKEMHEGFTKIIVELQRGLKK